MSKYEHYYFEDELDDSHFNTVSSDCCDSNIDNIKIDDVDKSTDVQDNKVSSDFLEEHKNTIITEINEKSKTNLVKYGLEYPFIFEILLALIVNVYLLLCRYEMHVFFFIAWNLIAFIPSVYTIIRKTSNLKKIIRLYIFHFIGYFSLIFIIAIHNYSYYMTWILQYEIIYAVFYLISVTIFAVIFRTNLRPLLSLCFITFVVFVSYYMSWNDYTIVSDLIRAILFSTLLSVGITLTHRNLNYLKDKKEKKTSIYFLIMEYVVTVVVAFYLLELFQRIFVGGQAFSLSTLSMIWNEPDIFIHSSVCIVFLFLSIFYYTEAKLKRFIVSFLLLSLFCIVTLYVYVNRLPAIGYFSFVLLFLFIWICMICQGKIGCHSF